MGMIEGFFFGFEKFGFQVFFGGGGKKIWQVYFLGGGFACFK